MESKITVHEYCVLTNNLQNELWLKSHFVEWLANKLNESYDYIERLNIYPISRLIEYRAECY